MRGRRILIEPLPAGGHAAALVVDGRLHDLIIDPDPADPTPRPEAIHRAVPGRPMKGLGGVIVDLGGGQAGFLRSKRPPPPGRPLLVQVAGWAEPGKATPVTDRLRLKGRSAILTPGAPGLNVSRAIRDPDARAALAALAEAAVAGAPEDLGLILRTRGASERPAAVTAEISGLRAAWVRLVDAATGGTPECLLAGPGAAAEAARDWADPGTDIEEGAAALAEAGIWEEIDALRQPRVPLGAGHLAIEPTRALVAVDVNTGADLSPAAALKANLAAARELPRQLRLRGLGGQVVIDFAPLAKPDRPRVEAALAAALRGDDVDTTIAGWTPLGHLELQRRRSRRPLAG
jgi:Ribonuclease G/E